MRKVIRKSVKKDSPLPKESQVDIWLSRLSHFSQIGLLIVAVFGYVYTVIPVYQKSLLDEQIAKKELELKNIQLKLDESYALNRMELIKNFVQGATYRCSGIDKLPKNASENFDNKRTIKQALGEVFEVQIKECLEAPFYKSKKFKESLRPEDIEILTKEVLSIRDTLEKLKTESHSKFYALEDNAKYNPEILAQVNINKSFSYRMLELTKSVMSQKEYESKIFAIKIEQEMENISSEYRKAIYENIGKLIKIDWPKAKDKK
jgi:hypothetical protein